MMWSFGALLELSDRAKLEKHLFSDYPHLDLPPSNHLPTDSIYDYRVDENGMGYSLLYLFSYTQVQLCLLSAMKIIRSYRMHDVCNSHLILMYSTVIVFDI